MTKYLYMSDGHRSAMSKLVDFDLPNAIWTKASRLVYEADSLGLPSDAFLGDDGSLAVAFYYDETCLEVVIEPDGSTSFLVKKGYGFDFEVIGDSEDALFRVG